MSTAPTSEILLAGPERGEDGPRYVASRWTLQRLTEPPDGCNFASCVAIVKQGPTHNEYAEAWRALLACAGVTYRGRVYRLTERKGAILGLST